MYLLLILPLFNTLEVSFNVEMTNFVTYNDGDKVIFDNVTSNGGNAFDNVTGISTVPHNGSYELTLRNMGNPRGIYTDIVRNNARLCRALDQVPTTKVKDSFIYLIYAFP